MQRNYWTPMHVSAANGYLKIVKLLLERGADIDAMNDVSEAPYQVSLRTGNREIADLLQKHDSEKGSTRSFYDLMRYLTGASILALRGSTP